MLSRLIELVTGDSETPEHRAETRDVPMLASFLAIAPMPPRRRSSI
jgi:conjugal transfer ATP-binding protein TraC